MAETLVPIFHVDNAREAAVWYERLGFAVTGEHQFEPDFPIYMFLRRGDVHLHLSEHTGDAPLKSLAYLYVDDIDTIAATFDVGIRNRAHYSTCVNAWMSTPTMHPTIVPLMRMNCRSRPTWSSMSRAVDGPSHFAIVDSMSPLTSLR